MKKLPNSLSASFLVIDELIVTIEIKIRIALLNDYDYFFFFSKIAKLMKIENSMVKGGEMEEILKYFVNNSNNNKLTATYYLFQKLTPKNLRQKSSSTRVHPGSSYSIRTFSMISSREMRRPRTWTVSPPIISYTRELQ